MNEKCYLCGVLVDVPEDIDPEVELLCDVCFDALKYMDRRRPGMLTEDQSYSLQKDERRLQTAPIGMC